MRLRLPILAAALGAALAAGPAGAATFHLSTEGGETLAGLSFTGGDVVEYDDSPPGSATTVFLESSFGGGSLEEVDAFELLPNGHMILSTTNPASLGGVNFGNGDLVEWDPVNLVASIFFNDTAFTGPGSTDTDAVAVLSNGHILLSTTGSQTLGGLAFGDGDVVEYEPLTGTTTLFLSEATLFGGADVDLDALDVFDDGRVALSHFENVDVTVGGLTFQNGDLVVYDPVGGTWSLLLDESIFGGAPANLDAIAVPEPHALGLLALGLTGLAFVRGRCRP
jgi:hypothetical protein